MVNRQDRSRFLPETSQSFFIFQKLFGKNLEGHSAVMLFRVLAKKYFAHPALAEPP
jgi:hypothetical protein